LGLDVGERRVGVAISDATGTLARPLTVVTIPRLDDAAVEHVATAIEPLTREEDGLGAVVVGLPTRLDGSPNAMTARVEAFAAELGRRTCLPVTMQDERLSSREAESRLALRERDWRVRKARIDAAAAAVILQDYLDAQ